jgi:hypothetical protein
MDRTRRTRCAAGWLCANEYGADNP